MFRILIPDVEQAGSSPTCIRSKNKFSFRYGPYQPQCEENGLWSMCDIEMSSADIVWTPIRPDKSFFLTLIKAPRKNASENVLC